LTIRWIDAHPNYTTCGERGEDLAGLAATVGQE
jgi:hypothetical protein